MARINWKMRLDEKKSTAVAIATPKVITKYVELPPQAQVEKETTKIFLRDNVIAAENYSIRPAGSVSIGTGATKIFSKNDKRICATIVNDSANAIYLSLGSAPVLNAGIRLNALGGAMVFGAATDIPYQGEVYGIAAGTSIVTITEISREA